jgi:hypothetical protein
METLAKMIAFYKEMDDQAQKEFAELAKLYAAKWPRKTPHAPLLRLVASDTAKR